MSQALGAFQSDFAKALFDPHAPWGASPQPTLEVYRNTVMGGCLDALAANFPSVVRRVGVDRFRAAAATYVRAQPPRDGRLLMYGETFAEFLGGVEPAGELPCLAGVARLDRLWIEAHTAEDAPSVEGAWLARLAPADLGALRLRPHPAARWSLFDDLPIYAIWAALREGREQNDIGAERTRQGDGALLTRPVDAVRWQPLDRCSDAFLGACADGCILADAAGAALDVDADADIATLLSGLLTAGALIGPGSTDARCA